MGWNTGIVHPSVAVGGCLRPGAVRVSRFGREQSGLLAPEQRQLHLERQPLRRDLQRASTYVDNVAASVAEIASILTTTTREAYRTSKIADVAKKLVLEASDDTGALTEAVRSIELVVDLISEVATKTNLLALEARSRPPAPARSAEAFLS
jgi:hypothetical protein